MTSNNEPHAFILTPDNLLDVLMQWMPDQLHRMRQFEAGAIKIGGDLHSLECQYMQTIGGEKFRIVDCTPMGDSGSHYFSPVGTDEEIILAFARRIESLFGSKRRRNELLKKDSPIEIEMMFTPGPFEKAPETSTETLFGALLGAAAPL